MVRRTSPSPAKPDPHVAGRIVDQLFSAGPLTCGQLAARTGIAYDQVERTLRSNPRFSMGRHRSMCIDTRWQLCDAEVSS